MMALAFVQPAMSVERGAVQAPALRGASIPKEHADLNSSFTATSIMALGATSAAVFVLAGKRQKGRGGNRCSVVKCRSVPTVVDVAVAKEKADLQSWAAKTLEVKGDHRAEEMAEKAEQTMHAYTSMKAAFEKGIPMTPAPVLVPASAPPKPASVAPAAQPVAATESVATKEEVELARKNADLVSWAAKTLKGKGDHRAEEMAEEAERKMHAYEAMKAAFEKGVPVAPAPAAAEPASAPPEPASVVPAAQPAAVSESVVTKEEVELARERADLVVWAAKLLKAKGLPQFAEMQKKADRKVKKYESLKSAFETGISPTSVAALPEAPAAPVLPAPAPEAPLSGHKPSAAELKQIKKEADLMVWAAQTLKDKGAPQYAEMQAKADKKMNTYESLKALVEA